MSDFRYASFVLRVRPWSLHALLIVFFAVGTSTALREIFVSFGATLFFATHFPAVLIVAILVGVPGAVLTVALTIVVAWWAYIPPAFEFGHLRNTDIANIATFGLSSVLIITVSHLYRTTLASLLHSEQARELLIGELNHRAGNTLGIMQAIVSGTVTSDSERNAVLKRIQALARANELVSKGFNGQLTLQTLIQNEAEPYANSDRLEVEGPEVQLGGETARSVALVLHELLTNASKYGALSNSHGKLLIRWSQNDCECKLSWTEVDGPAVVTPTRLGFGSRMMKASLAQIAATIEPEFRSDGYSCILTFRTAS